MAPAFTRALDSRPKVCENHLWAGSTCPKGKALGVFDASWWADRARYEDPGQISPRVRQVFLRAVAPVVRLLFRPTLSGLEHLPRDRPFLLVGNHSGGMAMAELLCLATLLLSRAPQLRVAAMAQPLSFALWPLTLVMRWTGAIPSSYPAAFDALSRGVGVLVFPGGEYESSRPFWQWRKVDFNNRQGFLRIAKQAGVPIVPMGIANSHLTTPVLWRSDLVLPWLLVLPRVMGLKRFPLSLLGLAGALALALLAPEAIGWPLTLLGIIAWLGSPLTLVPILPVQVRFHIGAPMPPEDLFAGEDLAPAYAKVVQRIQALVLS